MSDLIKRLEEATEGSRKLDEAIYVAIGCPYDDDPRYYAFLHGDFPPLYTASLDAKLPWENIAHVHAPDWHDAKPPGRWQAAVDVGEGCAVYGYGATEPLARRIAALKARGFAGALRKSLRV